MLSFLIINDIEYLITFSQGLIFETFDFLKNKVYTQGLFETIKYNSNVYKNAFFSLNYFNNTNYAFSAYVDKRERIFLMHKLYYRHANISYRKIIANQSEVCEGTQNSPVTCFEVTNLVECLYLDKFRTYEVAIFQISNYEEILKENIETHMVRFDFLFSKCIHIKEYIGAFIYFKDNNSFPVIKFKRINIIIIFIMILLK